MEEQHIPYDEIGILARAIARRIQDKATFYFTFENLLGNQYFIIPVYPMHPRGVRIGLSWDFIN